MTIPDPGTEEARSQGCVCPVLDNRGATPGTFIYDMACTLHRRQDELDPRLVTHVAQALDTDSWLTDEELAETAIHACLNADGMFRLYTGAEVGDAQASEAELLTRPLKEEIRELKRQNQALKDVFLASRLYDVIQQSGVDAIAQTHLRH